MTAPEPKSANELAQTRTDLAADRNLMASERTLMAWIRTALSMDSFGFTIYKLLTEFQSKGVVLPHSQTPRNMGLFLTGLGTLSMIAGTLAYWQSVRELRKQRPYRLWSATFVVALLMSALGLFLFLGIIRRIL